MDLGTYDQGRVASLASSHCAGLENPIERDALSEINGCKAGNGLRQQPGAEEVYLVLGHQIPEHVCDSQDRVKPVAARAALGYPARRFYKEPPE